MNIRKNVFLIILVLLWSCTLIISGNPIFANTYQDIISYCPDLNLSLQKYAADQIPLFYNPMENYRLSYSQLSILPIEETIESQDLAALFQKVMGDDFQTMWAQGLLLACRDDCPYKNMYFVHRKKNSYSIFSFNDWNGMLEKENWAFSSKLQKEYFALVFNMFFQDRSRFSTAWWAEPTQVNIIKLETNFSVTLAVSKKHWNWYNQETDMVHRKAEISADFQGRIASIRLVQP